MKALSLLTTILWICQLSFNAQNSTYLSPQTVNSATEITIDWRHKINRSHANKDQLLNLSKGQISKLYRTNIIAAEQFEKYGVVQSKGKTTVIDTDRNSIVFTIKDKEGYITKELWIYVYPNQRLIAK